MPLYQFRRWAGSIEDQCPKLVRKQAYGYVFERKVLWLKENLVKGSRHDQLFDDDGQGKTHKFY